ncbi:unnamed protein product, partial [Tetraodon nigroviridis]
SGPSASGWRRRQELAGRYEQQVQNIRAEFDKLKRGYHKLQHRRLEDGRPGLSTARLDATGRFRSLRTSARTAKASRFSPVRHSLARTGTRHPGTGKQEPRKT